MDVPDAQRGLRARRPGSSPASSPRRPLGRRGALTARDPGVPALQGRLCFPSASLSRSRAKQRWLGARAAEKPRFLTFVGNRPRGGGEGTSVTPPRASPAPGPGPRPPTAPGKPPRPAHPRGSLGSGDSLPAAAWRSPPPARDAQRPAFLEPQGTRGGDLGARPESPSPSPAPRPPARAPADGMVLLAGPGPEGGGALCVSSQPPSPPRDAKARQDPADYEEYEDFSRLPDTRSIASDDSFYPSLSQEEYGAGSAESVSEAVSEGVPEAATLLRAACANDVGLLKALVRRGPRVEEVRETDPNGRVSGRLRRFGSPSSNPPYPPHHANPDSAQVPRRPGHCTERPFLALGARGARGAPGGLPVPGGGGECDLSEVTAARRPHRSRVLPFPAPGVPWAPNSPWAGAGCGSAASHRPLSPGPPRTVPFLPWRDNPFLPAPTGRSPNRCHYH